MVALFRLRIGIEMKLSLEQGEYSVSVEVWDNA